MLEKQIIKTENAPAAIGPYSQATSFQNLIFVSGQLPIDPTTNVMAAGYTDQTIRSLENIKAILEAAGSSLKNVLKVNVYLRDMGKFSEVNQAYADFFLENPPARCAVEVSKLPKDALVEIEAVAIK